MPKADLADNRQPVRREVVTHVLGTIRYPGGLGAGQRGNRRATGCDDESHVYAMMTAATSLRHLCPTQLGLGELDSRRQAMEAGARSAARRHNPHCLWLHRCQHAGRPRLGRHSESELDDLRPTECLAQARENLVLDLPEEDQRLGIVERRPFAL